MLPLSRREFLAIAAVGRLSGPEWGRYADPATELQVIRLTDPAFASGMTASHLRQFTRRSDSLLYWSERYAAGAAQAFLLDFRTGVSRQLTEAAALDRTSLSLSPSERGFFYFDGSGLNEAPLVGTQIRVVYSVPGGAVRTGLTIAADGAAIFSERRNGRSLILSVLRQQPRHILEIDREVEEVMARPRRAQILYRSGGAYWLANTDGTANRELRCEPGIATGAMWVPSGRTLIYLHVPENPKELITLREHAPDDGTDTLLAKTSQFASAASNSDASVFAGASRNRASAYVLILLRVARRELTLCEHGASDPALVRPVFSPDSQNVLFVSDRHGKPAIYQVRVGKFVEQTSPDNQ